MIKALENISEFFQTFLKSKTIEYLSLGRKRISLSTDYVNVYLFAYGVNEEYRSGIS